MSVYTKRLGGPILLTNTAWQHIATVPTGKVWIVRNLLAVSPGALARCLITVAHTDTPIINRVFDLATAAGGQETRLALVAGEELRGLCGTAAGTIWATLTGYEFDA